MARPEISATLAAPIEAEGRHIGEIGVADKESREWTAEEVALLEAVGQQLGTAVERLRLLERIREQAYRVHQIVDTVPEGMILLGENWHVILANPLAREYLEVLAEAEVGDALTHLGGRPMGELLAPVAPGGRWHEISVTGPPARTLEVIARSLETGSDGDSAESEGWVMVMRDVTQEREFQERIQHQQRLAAVGQLAAGIAHDFNNIMAVVVLYSQMALRFPDVPPEVAERLHTILGQAKRATDLIQQILDFGRRSVLKRSPLDVEPLLKEQVKLLKRTLPENIRVEIAVGPGEHTANADVTRIQQVIMNLVLNSRDAMPEGGELHIALDRLHIKAGEPLPSQEMEPGEWIRIMVSDNGTGIPQEILPRVFEPFFTTKAPLGTGLGLSQVYGIVAQHGGHVTVESQVGEGTTFALFLPALPGIQHDTTVQTAPIIHEGRRETILIVEDDPTTRAALVDGVKGLNYQVLEAGDGQEALDICRAHEGRISLVLSDLIMPEMGGIALSEELHKLYPEIKMVMLSGHPLDEIRVEAPDGIAEWLQKPIDLDELAEALRRALQ
jgi:signal transduction histidine kinase